MTAQHKVFISYHHATDQAYKNRFVQLFSSIMVDWSVRLGDIPDGLATEVMSRTTEVSRSGSVQVNASIAA